MKKIFFLILALLPMLLFSQSASDYFHTAANFYVNANKKSAQKTIREGIQKYPDDATLKTLSSKIDELPDPEEDKSQQLQQKNQDKKEEEKQQQQQQQQQKQQQQQDKRQLDALQQNERQTQKKVADEEMKKGGKGKQEKDW